MSTHKCIVVRPGQPPVVEDVGDALEDWQKLVGGDIEGWNFSGRISVICNDNREGLPPNRFSPRLGDVCGTFFLAKAGADGDTVDIEGAELKACLEELATWKDLFQPGGTQN